MTEKSHSGSTDDGRAHSNVVTLHPGTHPHAARVTSGIADVFAVISGLNYPLGTVGEGAVVPAAREHVQLRVVPRLDSSVEFIETANLGTLGEAVLLFTSALEDRLGAFSDPFREAHPTHVPALIAVQVSAYVGDLDARRAAEATQRDILDSRAHRLEYDRLRVSITNPSVEYRAQTSDPLVGVLDRIGLHEGFAVRVPVGIADDASPQTRLESILHLSGVRSRAVNFVGNWMKPAASAFLGFTRSGEIVALIPERGRYQVYSGAEQSGSPVEAGFLAELQPEGLQLYAPLPRERAVSMRDLWRLAATGTAGTWTVILSMGALVALLGLLTPILTQWVLSVALPDSSTRLLVEIGILLTGVALSVGLFSLVLYFAISRVSQQFSSRVQPAVWDRLLAMPPSFFRRHSSGDLAVRVMAADALQQLVTVSVVGSVLTAFFALVNLVLMFRYSVLLGLIGLVMVVITAGVLVAGIWSMQRQYQRSVDAQVNSTSWSVQLLTGIGKLRLAGAATRMGMPYLDAVRRQMAADAKMTAITGRVNAWFTTAVALAVAGFFIAAAASAGGTGHSISAPTFLAFYTAFLTLFGGINGLIAVVSPIASAGPILRLMQPLLGELPESAQHRGQPGLISGRIEFRNVTFRYASDSPDVLRGLSFVVEPGEMVALVGPSGSGKSSTVRLLLGFEAPNQGQVLIDHRDLADLDLDLVRAQMGVVVQNGQISSGTLLSNIVGTGGGSEEDAWAAATAVGLADEIAAMPMRMQTMVNPSLLSGGQAQRVLLARAVARRPRIVIMDEATSALDNETQAIVSDSLDRLGVSRLVVAHRLSTIRNADRILVIVAGAVAESGTFESLMADNGIFADLVRRQLA